MNAPALKQPTALRMTQLAPQLVGYTGGPFTPKAMHASHVVHRGMKPDAVLWTSTWTPDAEDPSDWYRWCHGEQYADAATDHLTVLEVGPAAVFTIDGVEDLARFMTRAVRIPDYLIFGVLDDYNVDWTATAEAWGATAVRVTAEGHWATRMTRPFSTYSWDCESTAWIEPPILLGWRHLEREAQS